MVAVKRAYDCTPAPCPTPVTHSYAALAFYTRGRSRVELNGEWTLGEGDLLLVPAGQPHRMLEAPLRSSTFPRIAAPTSKGSFGSLNVSVMSREVQVTLSMPFRAWLP
jgi:hypothetical protein